MVYLREGGGAMFNGVGHRKQHVEGNRAAKELQLRRKTPANQRSTKDMCMIAVHVLQFNVHITD
jgi:hypothetical protein